MGWILNERGKQPMDRHFMAMLADLQANGRFLCVGLDPDVERVRPSFPGWSDILAVRAFCNRIIDATADIAGAFKPNIAFFEALGPEGIKCLMEIIANARSAAPNVPVILDAKRADIGNTNLGYILAAFEQLGADAITVNPYFGAEALEPFLKLEDKGIIVLCRTSNDGAAEFQDLRVRIESSAQARRLGVETDHRPCAPLYQVVADRVATAWNGRGNCCVVVGATYPEELGLVRSLVGDMPILIPGIGAQGGELEATVKNGRNSHQQGMIVNNSRALLFAHEKSEGYGPEEFDGAARAVAESMHAQLMYAAAA